MRILALDYGQARCGCAVSDPTETIVRPLAAVEPSDPAALAKLAVDHGAELIVVGLPVGLSGDEGHQAGVTRDFARKLADLATVPVETYDERFTTTLAEHSSRGGAQADPDSLAAAHLLETFLASRERAAR
jgi:putative holliday junction resolvase